MDACINMTCRNHAVYNPITDYLRRKSTRSTVISVVCLPYSLGQTGRHGLSIRADGGIEPGDFQPANTRLDGRFRLPINPLTDHFSPPHRIYLCSRKIA